VSMRLAGLCLSVGGMCRAIWDDDRGVGHPHSWFSLAAVLVAAAGADTFSTCTKVYYRQHVFVYLYHLSAAA
jgi:hypothetical protein